MSNDKMREEFEAWALARFINSATMKPLQRSADEPDAYHYPVLNTSWHAWQASREALVIELPDRFSEAYQDYFDDVEGGCFNESKYISDLTKSLEAAGVKVKS
ncbi:hypothetical protein [Pseudomonas syringae]|uniref:hypothetical protein n=1 Tax=Pseudomonas syringae TaxID=317 RepID=UPI0003F7FC42|nr:hypothetical protein [Pseudomonas syringae]